MPRRCVVFSRSIKGQAERDMGGCETRITFQSFGVGAARVAFFALLIKSEPFDVALFRTLSILRIGDRSCSRMEIRIVIDRRVGAIFKQRPAVSALQQHRYRLFAVVQFYSGRVELGWIEIDASSA